MSTVQVTIGVHERLDGKGYLVKITANGEEIKFPVDDFTEATLLAESVRDGIYAGIPLDVLMPAEACVPAPEGAR